MADVIVAADFEAKVLKADGPVLVDFFASWCGPCQAMLPVIDEIGSEGHTVYKVDVDEAGEIAQEYGIMSIPAFKVFKDGKVVGEAMGMTEKDELIKMLG